MRKNKFAGTAAVMLSIALLANAQDGAPTQPQPGYGFAPVVKQLLQIDAEKALATALGQPAQSSPTSSSVTSAPGKTEPAAPPAEPRPVLRLVGIYGHNGRWTAEVDIDGREFTFSPGDIWRGYRARRINGRCIELQHKRFSQPPLCTDAER